jgi:hypothetical protein
MGAERGRCHEMLWRGAGPSSPAGSHEADECFTRKEAPTFMSPQHPVAVSATGPSTVSELAAPVTENGRLACIQVDGAHFRRPTDDAQRMRRGSSAGAGHRRARAATRWQGDESPEVSSAADRDGPVVAEAWKPVFRQLSVVRGVDTSRGECLSRGCRVPRPGRGTAGDSAEKGRRSLVAAPWDASLGA